MAAREDLRPFSLRVPHDGQSGRETTRSPKEQFHKIETINYGTYNKNVERNIGAISFFQALWGKEPLIVLVPLGLHLPFRKEVSVCNGLLIW